MGSIVVGYDGSDSSKAALARAVELAQGLGDDVALVFGYSPPGIWGGEIAEHEESRSLTSWWRSAEPRRCWTSRDSAMRGWSSSAERAKRR